MRCHIVLSASLILAGSLFGCARDNPASAPAEKSSIVSTISTEVHASTPEPVREPSRLIDGARAMQYVRDVVKLGPRYLGSPGHKKLEDYLRARLKGVELEEDAFPVDSPEGKFSGRNFIAKFPGAKDGVIVIAGHYDTNYPLRKTGYTGANDGGSSTAILLELANHLRGKRLEGCGVWLVWLDAEEAMRTWTATDSVYGSRHLAAKWQQDGTAKRIKAFLLADMIGDADLNIERDQNSTPWLADLAFEAAKRLGYQSHFYARMIGVEDDHVPFVQAGVPSLDLIDMDYGYGDVFHHTPQDTLDKLSPRSLEIVGNVILETIQLLNERK